MLEILEKLAEDLIGLKKACEINGKEYMPKINYVQFYNMFSRIEYDLKIDYLCNLYFNAININEKTAVFLNEYISKRIGPYICFNICYDSSIKEYPSYVDLVGNRIENIHDYKYIKLHDYIK